MTRFCLLLLLATASSLHSVSTALAEQLKDSKTPLDIMIRGRVVCLDPAAQASASQKDCSQTPHSFGFLGSGGKLYRFLPTDSATDIFEDGRVRAQDLEITARPHPNRQLELIKVLAVKQGKLYDIFYFCDICNITAYAPGPCPCCRREMELREELVH
ncbi:MAG TPA: hypothetical protein VGQ81_03085 [Acidobacteriota bacterium]|jgi:rubrerythrin|nr:hypothetical protein [Acidobacteriota bacterium]